MVTNSMTRRAVLQSGAVLATPLAGAGLWFPSAAAVAAPPDAEPPISGSLAGWVVVEPHLGASFRLVQLDEASRPAREIAVAHLTPIETGASLQRIGQRAHDVAMAAVARSWNVTPAECVARHGRITHEGQGHAVGYTIWVDVV